MPTNGFSINPLKANLFGRGAESTARLQFPSVLQELDLDLTRGDLGFSKTVPPLGLGPPAIGALSHRFFFDWEGSPKPDYRKKWVPTYSKLSTAGPRGVGALPPIHMPR